MNHDLDLFCASREKPPAPAAEPPAPAAFDAPAVAAQHFDLLGAPANVNKLYDGALAGQGPLHPPLDAWTPPLMALWNSQGGAWKDRKKAWRARIPQSKGRSGGLLSNDMTKIDPHFYDAKDEKEKELGRKLTRQEFIDEHYDRSVLRNDMVWGTSRFDPVIAECLIRLFTAPGDVVVDPFAGGVERGYVTAALGRQYVGIELRQEQIDENNATLSGIEWPGEGRCVYIQGDSADAVVWESIPRSAFAFTCPPYHDLERYGGGADDLSEMSWYDFLVALRCVWGYLYRSQAANAAAVMIFGDLRDKEGDVKGLPTQCVDAMKAHGYGLANEIVYCPPVGSKRFTGVKPYKGRGTMIVATERILMGRKGDRKAWFNAMRGRGGGVKRESND